MEFLLEYWYHWSDAIEWWKMWIDSVLQRKKTTEKSNQSTFRLLPLWRRDTLKLLFSLQIVTTFDYDSQSYTLGVRIIYNWLHWLRTKDISQKITRPVKVLHTNGCNKPPENIRLRPLVFVLTIDRILCTGGLDIYFIQQKTNFKNYLYYILLKSWTILKTSSLTWIWNLNYSTS